MERVSDEAAAANPGLPKYVGWQVRKVFNVVVSSFVDVKVALATARDLTSLSMELGENTELLALFQGKKGVARRTAPPPGAERVEESFEKGADGGFGLTFAGAATDLDLWTKGPGVFIASTAHRMRQIVAVGGIDTVGATTRSIQDTIEAALGVDPDKLTLSLIDNPNLISLYLSEHPNVVGLDLDSPI